MPPSRTSNKGSSRAQPSRFTSEEGTDGALEARWREIQTEWDRSMERERGGRDGDGLREKWRELQREWDKSMERERGGRDGDGLREKWRELQREWDRSMERERDKVLCKICMDMTPTRKMFQTNKCSHKFCPDCLSQYITAKVRENISTVKCPEVGCKVVLTPGTCEKIIPKEVFEKWEIVLCETNFVGTRKFYCPFKNCSALMVDDGAENVTQAECPYCHRLFCAKCKVAWHAGVTCKTFKSLGAGERGREDLMLMELGEMKKWRRCPSCRIFVEKRSGCQHIVCRCGYEFCYGCRRKWAVRCNGCSGESILSGQRKGSVQYQHEVGF